MTVNFSEEKYFRKALALAKNPPESHVTAAEAVRWLLKDVPLGQIDLAVEAIREKVPDRSPEEIYVSLTKEPEDEILALFAPAAYAMLAEGLPLGSEAVPGTDLRTGDWIGHSLMEARACCVLAQNDGLDPERAYCMGLLHDIGRKKTHTFMHTVLGFETLVDAGLDAEALGCLTHSFVRGGRCANNEQAEPGFAVSPEGHPQWETDASKDQMALFLEAYVYTPYDDILTMADLMATARAIVPLMVRLDDIASRRTFDPRNRGYFLSRLISLCGMWTGDGEVLFRSGTTIPEMQEKLKAASAAFWDRYQTMDDSAFRRLIGQEA